MGRLDKMENSEDKLIQLHELVVSQRKTIDGLSKVNDELTTTVKFSFKKLTNFF